MVRVAATNTFIPSGARPARSARLATSKDPCTAWSPTVPARHFSCAAGPAIKTAQGEFPDVSRSTHAILGSFDCAIPSLRSGVAALKVTANLDSFRVKLNRGDLAHV